MGSLMTVVHNKKISPARIAGSFDHFKGDGVCLTTRLQGGATVVAATGELDASNIHHLSDYARRYLGDGRPVVLDLSELDFLGAQGIRTLLDIDDECVRHKLDWALVSGRPVSRLLRVCDRDGQLPMASSIEAALQAFSAPWPRTRSAKRRERGLLQLVTKSG